MAQELANIAIKLSANMVSFENDLGRANRLAQKQSKNIKKSFSIAFAAVTAAAVATGGSLLTLVKQTANTADQMQKLSVRLGVSTEFLSQMRHGLDLTDVSFEGFNKSLIRMSKSFNDAENGLSTAKRAFDALGISLDEMRKLNPEEQFLLIADRLSKVESQSIKTGAAMDIFGKSGSDLLTLFEGGADGIAKFRKEADDLGLTIDKLTSDQAAEFNDELTRLTAQFTGMAREIGQELIPQFTEMVTHFRNSEFVKNFADNVKAAIQWVVEMKEEITFLVKALGTLFIVAKVNALMTLMAAGLGAASVAMGGASIAAGVLSAALTTLKSVAAVLGGPIGIIALGALAIYEFGENSKGAVPNTEAFRKATDRLAKSFKDLNLEQRRKEIADARFALQDAVAGLASLKDFAELKGPEQFTKAIKDSEDAIKDLKNRLSSLKGEYKKLLKPQEKAGDSLSDLNDTLVDTKNAVGGVTDAIKDELSDAFDGFTSVMNQFQTPMEALNAQYLSQIEAIGRYAMANGESAEVQNQVLELTNRVIASYQKQKTSIENTLSPYDQLIASLKEEVAMLGMTDDQLIQLEAKRLLEQAGIIKSTDNLDEYNKKLAETVMLLGKTQGVQLPGGSMEAFGGVFQAILDNVSNSFADTFDAVGGALMQMSQGGGENSGNLRAAGMTAVGIGAFISAQEAGLDMGGSLLKGAQAVLAMIPGWGQAIAAAMEIVDAIAGGKLFGTAFETKRTTRTLNVDQGGGSGGVSTLQTRQRSFFGGLARNTIDTDLDSEVLKALEQLFENAGIALQASAEAVGGMAGDLITGSFVEVFDKDGNLVSSTSEIMGRKFEETFEEFAQRLTAENILAGVSSVFEEAGHIADRWRGDAETLLEGAQMLLQAGADITAGNGLFESLTAVTTVITDMQQAGETLAETYNRVQSSTLMFESALDVMGMGLDLVRVEFVRLAADITDAAGGLEQAQGLWASYFQTFYTEQELFEQRLASAIEGRDTALGDLGLDSNTTVDQFRQMFESVLPDLSAEAIVEWLRAADALGVVVNLESELNEIREENAAQLAELIAQVSSEMEDMNLSGFAKQLKDVRKAFEAQIRTARELGASEQELAMIQAYATRQIQNAISALENDIGSALTDLYGTELDQINEQISLLEQQESQIGNVANATANLYRDQLNAIQNIQAYLQNLIFDGNLSPLNTIDQLSEAQALFDSLLAAAQGGDVDALNELPQVAQLLLSLGRDVFASSTDYQAIFDYVTEALGNLGVTAEPNTDPQQTIITQNSQMISLMTRRNELEAAFDSQARLEAATAIAAQLRDLASVTGESFTELADRLGIPVEAFLGDLGVSLDQLTVETASALAQTAVLLGVEITDLAASVGISLGELANQNSLINDALENTIASLPEGIQAQLFPLLRAVEQATDPQERERLLNDLIGGIDGLSAEQRDLLAPYFDQIDPITEAQQQVNLMDDLNVSNNLIRDELAKLNTDSATRELAADQDRNNMLTQMNNLNNNITQFINIVGS